MEDKVYLFTVSSNTASPHVIHSRASELKIAVYPVDQIPFAPNKDEIQLYGYLKKSLLVFETIDIDADDSLEMLSAIRWYTNYIGYPNMEILPDDPRKPRDMAIAL
jgi:hypothetical protein